MCIVTLPNTRFITPSTHLLEVTEKTFLMIKENVQIGIHPKNISRDNGKNCMEGNNNKKFLCRDVKLN